MVIACWSVKGGCGTTVVAAALALRLARSAHGAVLADLAGDAAAVLGRPEPPGPGLADWVAAGPDVAGGALERLAVEVAPGLALIGLGAGSLATATTGDGERLVAALAALGRSVVVDCGSINTDIGVSVAAGATRSL